MVNELSRTDKDIPYHVRVKREGFVSHNHDKGYCDVAKPGDRFWRRWSHVCKRVSYEKVHCLHKRSRPDEVHRNGRWQPVDDPCDEFWSHYVEDGDCLIFCSHSFAKPGWMKRDGFWLPEENCCVEPYRFDHWATIKHYDPDIECAKCDMDDPPTCEWDLGVVEHRREQAQREHTKPNRTKDHRVHRAKERNALHDARYGGDMWERLDGRRRENI